MFTSNDIQARVRQRPFVPMRVKTSGGEAYEITHPDLIMVGRRELMIGRPSREEPSQYDGLSRVSILHVTAIEDMPATTAASSNGEH